MLSRIALSSTAAEIRAADAQMRTAVSQLLDANVWTGEDAVRFQNEWNDLVTSRLQSAAAKIEGASLVQFSPF